ncbi:MAG: hypothetical protein CM15mV57_040 [uncultured marine virus]|nr:MAG: hypothetical protein CM15mV57_040 [uncultured marine virus]
MMMTLKVLRSLPLWGLIYGLHDWTVILDFGSIPFYHFAYNTCHSSKRGQECLLDDDMIGHNGCVLKNPFGVFPKIFRRRAKR